MTTTKEIKALLKNHCPVRVRSTAAGEWRITFCLDTTPRQQARAVLALEAVGARFVGTQGENIDAVDHALRGCLAPAYHVRF